MSDAAITKRDLDHAVSELRGETAALGSELRGEMATLGSKLRGEMATLGSELRREMVVMKVELVHEIGKAASHVANVMMEQIQTLVSVVDEKYQDLPLWHAKLRADFDSHAGDRRIHARAPTIPSKRTRGSRPR